LSTPHGVSNRIILFSSHCAFQASVRRLAPRCKSTRSSQQGRARVSSSPTTPAADRTQRTGHS
jgi:hypothetical protein